VRYANGQSGSYTQLAGAQAMIRYFTLERARLRILTPAQLHPQTGGRQFVGDLVWERET
jgi:hypothetical protein